MIIYFALLVTAAAFLTISSLLVALFAFWKRFWIATEGVILKTDIEYSKDEERRLVTHYCIHYAFRVDGTRYLGKDKIRIEAPYYEEKETTDLLSREYAAGMRIEVFYPNNAPRVNSARREHAGFKKLLFATTVTIFATIVCYYMRIAADGGRQ